MNDDWEDEELKLPTPRRLRLIPLTMVMLSLMFIIKVNEVYIGSRQLRELYTARDAVAETGAKEEAKPDAAKAEAPKDAAPATDKPAEAAKDAAAPADAAKAETKPADAPKDAAAPTDAKAEVKKDEPKKEGDKKEGDKKEGEAAKAPEEPKTFGTGKTSIKDIEALKAKDTGTRFSQSEIDLLENLAKRRDELDKREKELDIKEKVLDATQKRINDRIEEMKTLEAQLSKVVAQYNEKQNAQIASLVKIYEGMKPQQAAAIFNELDMPILLEVIDKMSERKVAPVLAMMDPKKARDVTEELAAMRKSSPKKPAAGTPAKK